MSVETGRRAETQAAVYLEEQGFRIMARNWRTRWCEIDLVAVKEGVLHFIEVKYRRSTDFGSPADYITADKAQRLRRAAEAWNHMHHYTDDYQIDLVSVTPEVIDHLLNIG